MVAKRSLLKSLVKLLEMALPQRTDGHLPNEAELDPSVQLAIRVVINWAELNEVHLPRLWVVYSAERMPPLRQDQPAIHWILKLLFTQIRKDHASLMDEKHRFKLELAIATANRACFIIEQKDEDEDVDSEEVVGAYATMFVPT